MSTPSLSARRPGWLRTLHQWHWISSAVSLVGMLLFAVTGLTLNHADDIEARPAVTSRQADLPAELQALVAPDAATANPPADHKAPIPLAVRGWLDRTWGLALPDIDAEWSADEIYLSLPRPGGDAWLRIERAEGRAEYELTDRGWISYLNDLHKGRHTGAVWKGFLDVFSVACVLFSITGLLILQVHAAQRPSAWPLVGLGLVLPLLLILLFIH